MRLSRFFFAKTRMSMARADRFYKHMQILSSSWVSFSHGSNDATKVMGIIVIFLAAQEGLGVSEYVDQYGVPALGDPRAARRPWPSAPSCRCAPSGSSGRWARRSPSFTPSTASAPRPAERSSSRSPRCSGCPVSTTHVVTSAVTGTGLASKLGGGQLESLPCYHAGLGGHPAVLRHRGRRLLLPPQPGDVGRHAMAKSRLDKIRRTLGGETTLEGVIDAMGKEREEQVLERLAEFADQVVVIVEKLQDVVERFAADRYEELAESARELDELESAADDTKEAILDQLSLGGVFPMHRADLARLVGSMDNIANLATGAADRISMRRFSLPAEMNEQLVAHGPGGSGGRPGPPRRGRRHGHRPARGDQAGREGGQDREPGRRYLRRASTGACSTWTSTSRPSTSSRPSSSAWRTSPTAAARTPSCSGTWRWSTSRTSEAEAAISRPRQDGGAVKIGLAQLNSRQNKAANLAAAGAGRSTVSPRKGVDLVLLPEMFNFHGLDDAYAAAAETIPGPSTEWARDKAREHGIFLHCGSLAERRGDTVYNTSVVFDRAGPRSPATARSTSSTPRRPTVSSTGNPRHSPPANEMVVCDCEGVTVGLAICYDLRFPELFHALADRGPSCSFCRPPSPSPPGSATGSRCSGRAPSRTAATWPPAGSGAVCARPAELRPQHGGRSLGMVIAQCREGVDTLSAELDMDYLRSVRERLPVQRHRRRDLFG